MEKNTLRHTWMGLLVLTTTLVILLGLIREPSTSVIAPPELISGETRFVPPVPPASSLPRAEQGRRLVWLNTGRGAYSLEQLQALQAPLDEALSYVSERTTMQLADPINIRFERASLCHIDGITYPAERLVVVRVCRDTPLDRAVNILAHEFMHQLAYDHYGSASTTADLVLSEGFATWGAGEYWLGDAADFRSFVRQHYADQSLPLWSDYHGHATPASMNQLYYQWASLIEWIMTTYGRETFDRLYATSRTQQPGSAGYGELLGKDRHALEHAWREWLRP